MLLLQSTQWNIDQISYFLTHHCSAHSFIHSLSFSSLIHPFFHSHSPSLIHSLTFIHKLVHWFLHSYSLVHSLNHLFTITEYKVIHSFIVFSALFHTNTHSFIIYVFLSTLTHHPFILFILKFSSVLHSHISCIHWWPTLTLIHSFLRRVTHLLFLFLHICSSYIY